MAEALAPWFGAKHGLLTARLCPGGRGLGSCDTRCSLPALQGCQMCIWRAWRCCCHPLQPSASWQARGFEENHVAGTEECFSIELKREEQLYLVFPRCFFHLVVVKLQSLWVRCSMFLLQAELFLPGFPRASQAASPSSVKPPPSHPAQTFNPCFFSPFCDFAPWSPWSSPAQ